MNTANFSGPFGEIKSATVATGAPLTVSATTNASAYIGFYPGTEFVQMEGRAYSTAVVIRYAFNPWLTVLKTTDAFAVSTNATDYSAAAQDLDATTDVVLSSLATTGALWVGAELPFRGVFADVDSAANQNNTGAATCVAFYYNGTTMAALTAGLADSTSSGSAVFAQDGAISWTVPTDWAKGTLRSIASAAYDVPMSGRSLYWVKLTFDGALDSATKLDALFAMNRSTQYASLPSGREVLLQIDRDRVGCIEAVTDAGTASLLLNCLTARSGKFV